MFVALLSSLRDRTPFVALLRARPPSHQPPRGRRDRTPAGPRPPSPRVLARRRRLRGYTAPDVASMAQQARHRRDGVEGARKTRIKPYPWASSDASAASSADNCSFFVGGASGKLTHL